MNLPGEWIELEEGKEGEEVCTTKVESEWPGQYSTQDVEKAKLFDPRYFF